MADEQSSDTPEEQVSERDESQGGAAHAEPVPLPPARRSGWKRRHWGFLVLLVVLLGPAVVFGTWALVTLNYSYSKGERAGYVQKLSKKGWLCKTWEGELAMANIPGAMPEIFHFSVRNDLIAQLIDKQVGKRVSLTYEEHRGVPTSCFAETNYYITNVRPIEP